MLEIGPEFFGDGSGTGPCSRFLPSLTQLPHL